MRNIRARPFGWDGSRLVAICSEVTSENSKKDSHFPVISRALPIFIFLCTFYLSLPLSLLLFLYRFSEHSETTFSISLNDKILRQTPEVPECCITATCVFEVISFHKSTSAQENEGNTGLSSQVRVCFISILA